MGEEIDTSTPLDSVSSITENQPLDSRYGNGIGKQQEQVMYGLTITAAAYFQTYLNKIPCHNREYSGWAALMSILNGNPSRCKDILRMRIETLFLLCKLLVEEYGLKGTRSVTIEEEVATFLMATSPRIGNRTLLETFQRSGFTISQSFHRVLKACTRMSMDWVLPFHDNSVTHDYIRSDDKYWPYFKDCIGAIDGTHIKAALRAHLQVPYIGRKGIPTQNIMVACDFDMCFTFVLPGWEGSAHDTRIFLDTIRNPNKGFPMPPPANIERRNHSS